MYLQKIKHKVDPSKGFEYPLTVFHFAYPTSSVFVARLSMYRGPSVRMSHKTSQKKTFPFSVEYKTPKEVNHLSSILKCIENLKHELDIIILVVLSVSITIVYWCLD